MNTDKHRFRLMIGGLILTFAFFNSACFMLYSLPPSVENFLNTADKIEIIADADKQDGTIKYRGDMIKTHSLIAVVTDEESKKKITRAFSRDTGGNGDASCFLPNHILRATKNNQTVEIEICYQCSRFEVKGYLGEFSGGLNFKSSETVLNQILFEKGVEIK